MNSPRNLLQESLVAIERLQARVSELESRSGEPIAIVGAGCRFPGANDPQALWELLRDRRDMIRDVPPDRWAQSDYSDLEADRPGKSVPQRAGFLDGLDQFDAPFFSISGREAAALDPQHRLLLETAQEAFESAGIATDRLLSSKTGVFVGISTTDYGQMMLGQGLRNVDVYAANGGALNTAAGRIAYVFGLEGPALAVDTACSSSLVAIHLAVQSLRRGETDLAVASGVNVVLQPTGMVLFARWGLMAPDGLCKTFDDAADGFVRAEGCGTIVLKRLSDALAADDPILAVVRGTAVNSDGRSSGLTAPHGPSQESVIRAALQDAGLEAGDIDYIEAHGTGTPLGDPIEIEAIGAVMQDGHGSANPLIVGALKPNIGHAESAAGMSGILKIVTALSNEGIPPNIHFSTPSLRIDWANLPIRVPTDLVPWPRRPDRPRRAGISGFGFSGTNAHVIIEEAPVRQKGKDAGNRPMLALISARSPVALRAMAGRYAGYIAANPHVGLPDVLTTLAVGRSHAQHRVAFPASSLEELRRGLAALESGGYPDRAAQGNVRLGEAPRVAFLFTGQGSQYSGMGRELYDHEPIFRAEIDRCADLLAGSLDVDLRSLLFSDGPSARDLSKTAYTQPALFAFEFALAALWRSYGLVPSMVVGHSVGEYVAACVADVFSLEDGLRLITRRGRLMQELPPGGAMAAIFASEMEVDKALKGLERRVSKAAINGSAEIVISGDGPTVAQISEAFRARNIEVRALDVSHAFHSPLLDPMLDSLERAASQVMYAAPRIPLVSNVTGRLFGPGQAPDAAYWRRHAREAVRFADALQTMAESGIGVHVEIGPQPTLIGLAARDVPSKSRTHVGSLRRGRSDQGEMNNALRDLYVAGVHLDWARVASGWGGQRIPLPPYPFQRERHWMPSPSREVAMPAGSRQLLGARQWMPAAGRQFLAEISPLDVPWIADHVVLDAVLMPAAAFIEMALEAALDQRPGGQVQLQQLLIKAPLRFEANGRSRVHTELQSAGEDGNFLLVIRSQDIASEAEWTENVRVVVNRTDEPEIEFPCPSAAEALARVDTQLSVDAFYSKLADAGLTFGPAFRPLRSIAHGNDVAIGEIEAPSGGDYVVHPALIDGAFQLISCLIKPRGRDDTEADDTVYIPLHIDSLQLLAPAEGVRLVGIVTLVDGDTSSDFIRANLRLERPDGTPVLQIRGLHVQRITRDILNAAANAGMSDYCLEPRWAILPTPDSDSEARRLILVADEAGLADAIARRVTGAIIVPREDLRRRLHDADDRQSLVVDFISEPPPHIAITEQIRATYREVLQTTKVVLEESRRAGLCVVTRGAQAVIPGESGSIVLGGLSGLIRTVAAEASERIFGTLDLDPAIPADAAVCADCLLRLRSDEPMLAVRMGEVRGLRVEPLARKETSAGMRRMLQVSVAGDLSGLVVANRPRRVPEPNEIEIAVVASGINFRDVLTTLGMVGDAKTMFGSECAGVVTSVGENVTHLGVGDRVVALGEEAFGTHVTVSGHLALRIPDQIGFADAVTLPNTYLTAWLGLAQIPNLGRDHAVLVHAAAGGVGFATVQLAKHAGATVIATAGSPAKRAFALSQGASHCFDSRSPSFRDDVLRVTGGKGVDLVLNSLTGDLVDAGLKTVRPGGIFVEIGKTDIRSPERIAREAPGIRYKVIDLGSEIAEARDRIRDALERIVDRVAQGELPALPVQAFPLDHAIDAFRFVANARHIGKVVLKMPPIADRTNIRPDGSYLVSGGLGGLGLEVASWLSSKGAGAIVLVGRNPPEGENARRLQSLQGAGAKVVAFAGDVSDADALHRLRKDVLVGLPPLRGVFHAAGVLADAPLAQQSDTLFDKVIRPKADAALQLHAFSRRDPIEMFVLFSSTSSIFGSPGQANYAAANSFLNAFAAWRQWQGLPATAIAWGAWGGVGMAAGLGDVVAARWARMGIGLLRPDAAMEILDAAIASEVPLSMGLRMNRKRFETRGGATVSTLLGSPPPIGQIDPALDNTEMLARISIAPNSERRALLSTYVHREVARVLGFRAESLDAGTPLSTLGFDSLMAVQMRARIEADLAISLPMTSLLPGPSTVDLAEKVISAVMASAGKGGPEGPGEVAEQEAEEGTL